MNVTILRHKTAIRRDRLSTPMKALWNLGFFDKPYSVLDYGCGLADDVCILKKKNVSIIGWDPHFFPNSSLEKSDIVNIGYVLNVIEDIKERNTALTKAFSLANRVLSIAVMLNGQGQYQDPKPYKDGFLTTRKTFQKYYNQEELKNYIINTIGVEPIPVAPGVMFVFTKPSYEQEFLFQKQSIRRYTQTNLYSLNKLNNKLKWEEHKDLVNEFWQSCLYHARIPTKSEFIKYDEIEEKLGRVKKVFKYLLSVNDESIFEAAVQQKRDNVLVYLALNFFEQRKSFSSLGQNLKNDIKSLFGSYKNALEEAKKLLFATGKQESITVMCEQAANDGLGIITKDKYMISSKYLSSLPPILRIYIGCTSIYYGDLQNSDIISLQLNSTKIVIKLYDDFEKFKVPILLECMFVELNKLRSSFVSFRDRNRIKRLYLKSRFLSNEDEDYENQVKFDKILLKYVNENLLHSELSPTRIINALPKTHKKKYQKELNR